MAIDAPFIVALAREYYGMHITAKRALEIAAEVGALNESVRVAAKGLPFDCGPDEFVTTLQALTRGSGVGE